MLIIGHVGYRPESTLQAFAHALEIGVDVLEMDLVFTKDGVVRVREYFESVTALINCPASNLARPRR